MVFWAVVIAVSLFLALSLNLLQTKLSATANDIQRCSFRTMGEWANFTRRRWLWHEFRFEVQVSTPKIKISLGPTSYMMKEGLELQDFKQYKFYHAVATGGKQLYKPALQMNASDNAWFLSAQPAFPQYKCSWLTLLEDTAKTNVQVTIEEKVSIFDTAMDGCVRPLASADRTSFLTLMSLFGIRWENEGRGKDLTGVGDTCEVSVINHERYGSVFSYRELLEQNERYFQSVDSDPNSKQSRASKQKYYLTSERARLAMFNCFDLGFATFRTHDESELLESLKHRDVLSSDKQGAAGVVVAYYKGSRGWCPGLSESITCWAEQSMPKMVDEHNGKFKSIFSAVPARSLTTGTPQFVAMLLGDGSTRYHSRKEIQSVGNVTEWASEYLQSFPQVDRKVYGCLKWAATWSPDYQNNIVDPDIPWAVSLECLRAVRELDEHLEEHLLKDVTNKMRIKSAMSNQQIIHGCNLFRDAKEAAETHSSPSWLDELDRVGAENCEKIVTHLVQLIKDVGVKSEPASLLAQRIVVNRLMRGSLWVVHNGNAPDQYKRVLECSLSSSLLNSNPTIYIT